MCYSFSVWTGGAFLGSFTSPIVHQDLGCVGGVEFVTLQQKPYLHLHQDGTQVCTVVLCNRSEEPLQELKVGDKHLHWKYIGKYIGIIEISAK